MRKLLLFVVLIFLAGPAHALQFQLQYSFDTGPFQPDGAAANEGTPRGLAVDGSGNLLIADSLDDQVYEAQPDGTFVRAMEANPYCELSGPPTCLPGAPAHSAGFLDGVAVQAGGNIWVVDDPNSGPTLLHELDADGVFLNEFDISASVGNPGEFVFDPRNGDILMTELSGGTSILRLDENDPAGLWLQSYNITDTSAPVGFTHFDGDTFLILDGSDDVIYEYLLPAGAGTATLVNTVTLIGLDLSVTDALGLAYDAASQRLYIANNNIGDPVHVLTLVPEPGTAALLLLGLVACARGRRRP